jgi:peptide/nickel transport system substrate-binding protein
VPTAPPTGGTLRAAMDFAGYEADYIIKDKNNAVIGDLAWDPAVAYDARPWEVFRCCLLRTLVSYNGHSLQLGGAVLQPDLATDLPTVSADGLTWTFHLRQGIHYAPPMADKEVVAQDFVRAIERALRPDPGGNGGSYSGIVADYVSSVITGGADFAQGTATSISGLETPDNYTLVVHLVQPTGDLGERLAMPAYAPLPAGAADGHDAWYGRYLVASGPYMIEGSDQLNPSLPPDQQPPVSGYVPNDHVYLVRNPSWDRSTDQLRTASADRIEITNLANDPDSPTKVTTAIQADQTDVSFDDDLTTAEVATLRTDPGTAPRVHVMPGLESHYIDMNLAVPPFDDIHVRRAVQLATDKQAIGLQIDPNSIIQTHAIPDAFENGLLTDYAPVATAGGSGDLAAAKAEMAQSVYDTNHDGVCDNLVCADVPMPIQGYGPNASAIASAAQTFTSNLDGIGIQIRPSPVAQSDSMPLGFYGSLVPSARSAFAFNVGWQTDYLSADGWFGELATSAAVSEQFNNNFSMIGATPQQLTQFGYSITSVPSLDSSIDSCRQLSGADSFGCWSGVDQYVMQRIAAWIPLSMTQTARLTSTSVTGFDFDASLTEPSLAQIQVNH